MVDLDKILYNLHFNIKAVYFVFNYGSDILFKETNFEFI